MSLNLLKRDFSYEKSLKKNEKKFQPYFFFHFSTSFNILCVMILPQVHLRKPCYDFSFL